MPMIGLGLHLMRGGGDYYGSKMLEITAQDIKNHMKKKGVGWGNYRYDEVDVGEPFKYYNSAWRSYVWLVPAFDKSTGEYISAINVHAPSHKNSDGTFGVRYTNGPSWYSNYLAILAGEPTQPEIYDIPTHFDVDTSSQDSGLMSSFSNSSAVNGYNLVSNHIMLDDLGANADLSDDNIELSNSSFVQNNGVI